MNRPANCRSRGSSRNAPMPRTRPATAACGSRSNASTARNSWSSAGPIPKAGGRVSAPCCWPITIPTEGWSMPAAPAPASTPPSLNGCGAGCSRWRFDKMPLDVPPPRTSRFGSPLVLSRVHWVRPELVAEVKFLTWTDDNLLRQVVYQGLREDKPAVEVRRAGAASHNGREKQVRQCGQDRRRRATIAPEVRSHQI